jgi:hypothetical protein
MSKRHILKRIIFAFFIAGLSLVVLAQEISHESIVINIEVPVRVFKSNRFVNDLTINDFIIYEDGKLQQIEAVYLIKKTNIQREEAEMKKEKAQKIFSPDVSRNFVLLFEIMDYLPKIDEALDYFFEQVISPGDTLVVVTPVKSYNFRKDALNALPKQEIAKRLKEIIRRDINLGSGEYKGMIRDYENLFRSEFEGDIKLYLMMEKIRELKALRYMPEKKVQYFADYLKSMAGQKFAFFFYQKELIPFPDIPFESREYLELQSELASFMSFDVKKIKHAFSDSSISLHFLYITKTQTTKGDVLSQGQSVMDMQDLSSDIFHTFNEIAKATGGLTESSINIASLLKKAADASENYYLLYYSPNDYKRDGKFRKIEVKVKNKNYRITHRAGYFAN